MGKNNIIANLQDKIALVTGAGRGIGRSISKALANAGAQVVVCSRTAAEIEKVVREISSKNGRAIAVTADVAKENEVVSMFESVEDRFGRIDILVNNAGVGRFGSVADFEVDQFDELMAVNLRGTFLCCRSALKMMIPQKKGYIINISSVVGIKGYPNQAAYTASKHGIMGFTKSLAVEAQEHNIRVSAILPGGVDTDLFRNARKDINTSAMMHPADIANTVIFLLSLSERAAIDQIYIRRQSSRPF
jgi:NAD(P)-dependent dehydrogenase (short-subunit alcohol dehydrogenase family)